jgi:hypothetical protein
MAGKYSGGEQLARDAVTSLAVKRGRKAEWRTRDGVAYAPWFNIDDTERILALMGADKFVITRPIDLPRVLAVARALSERRKEEGKDPLADTDALLAMEKGITFALSVEGARRFVRGQLKGIPVRLHVEIGEAGGDGQADQGEDSAESAEAALDNIVVRAIGWYDSPEQAEAARAYWEKRRRRYTAHPLLALIGMTQPLSEAVIEQNQERIEARTSLTLQQMRVALGFLRNALAPPEPIETQPSPSETRKPAPGPPVKTPLSGVQAPATDDKEKEVESTPDGASQRR